jgi:hypothetical protein
VRLQCGTRGAQLALDPASARPDRDEATPRSNGRSRVRPLRGACAAAKRAR